jgi:hypothetical protein
MNRRARLRLRGMACLADAAHDSAPIGGDLGAREDGVVRADDAGVTTDPVVGVGEELDGTVPWNGATVRAATADGAVEDIEGNPGRAGIAGEPSTTELAGGEPKVNWVRALRALRMARALRLAIALGLSPGAGVE